MFLVIDQKKCWKFSIWQSWQKFIAISKAIWGFLKTNRIFGIMSYWLNSSSPQLLENKKYSRYLNLTYIKNYVRRNKPLNFCLSNDWKKKTRTFQASTLCTAEFTNLFIGSGCWPASSRCCFLVYIALFFTHSTIPICGTIQLE